MRSNRKFGGVLGRTHPPAASPPPPVARRRSESGAFVRNVGGSHSTSDPPNPPCRSCRSESGTSLLLGLLLVASLIPAAVAGAEPVLVERILAVVDGRPVLLSEVRVVEQLTGQERGPSLEALIDERLMFREASRLPQAALSPDEETRALESLR